MHQRQSYQSEETGAVQLVMHRLFEHIQTVARTRPGRVAVADLCNTMTYVRLFDEIKTLSAHLAGDCTAILLDNGIEWAICDLALLHSSTCCVPLPVFFSDAQLQHVIEDSGVTRVITDDPRRVSRLCKVTGQSSLQVYEGDLTVLAIDNRRSSIPANILKVTYTSGTTGTPKGVCLDSTTIFNVTGALSIAAEADAQDTALSLLPLSTLLENIAGIYVPLLAGATCIIPGYEISGISGSSGLDIERLLQCINTARPTSLVLLPQLLHALVIAVERGMPLPPTLRFVAVGGARVSPHLLRRARDCSIPVYEGYGLSEAGSVVSLNTPRQQRPGSAGKPLPHLRVTIEEGEVIVSGQLFNGYLHDASQSRVCRWATGDTGYLDADGYLHLTGRKRDIYCTAYGRNVDPAWVENELLAEDAVLQAVVYGDARPFNIAILVPRPGMDKHALQLAVENVNARLPDYAWVSEWLVASAPFAHAGQGPVRRAEVIRHFAANIEDLYKEVVQA